MSKEKGFREFCTYLFYGITAVQIVFAVIWLFLNIAGYREEFISNNYIEAATTLKVDDYMGILYALIVKALGHGAVLYLAQIVMVFATALALPVKDRALRYAVSLNIITNPLVLQSECTVRPEALLLAGMLLIFSLSIKGKHVISLIPALSMSLLNPDYTYVCLVILLPLAVFEIIKKRKQAVIFLLGVLTSSAITFGVNNAVTDVYAYGNVEKSFNFLCMQRFAGGDIRIYDYIICDHYGEDLSYEMSQADKTPEKLSLSFGTAMERVGGKENAEGIYQVFAKNALAKGPGYYGPSIARDFVYYLLTPVATMYVLKNQLTGTLIFNPVRMFISESHTLFKTYIYFGSLSITLVMLLCVVTYIIACAKKRGKTLNPQLVLAAFIAIVLATYGMFGCLRGFDYRNVLFNVAAWPLLLVIFLDTRKEEE